LGLIRSPMLPLRGFYWLKRRATIAEYPFRRNSLFRDGGK
jgi:hypothetical protein